jgi:hypothetical protein
MHNFYVHPGYIIVGPKEQNCWENCWLVRITDSGVYVRSCTLFVFVCNFTFPCAFSRSNTPKLRPRFSLSSKSPKYSLQSSPWGLRKQSALRLILSIIVKPIWHRLSLHWRLLTKLHSAPRVESTPIHEFQVDFHVGEKPGRVWLSLCSKSNSTEPGAR